MKMPSSVALVLFFQGLAVFPWGVPAFSQVPPATPKKQTGPSVHFRADDDSSAAVAELRRDVSNLQVQLGSIKTELDDTKKELLRYQLRQMERAPTRVSLDVASRAFQRIYTDIGSFLVSVAEVTPFLDGYKIHLNVGNTAFATFRGISATVEWGPRQDGEITQASVKKYLDSRRNKKTTFSESLKPGTWNTLELILTPAEAKDLASVSLSLNAETVSLSR